MKTSIQTCHFFAPLLRKAALGALFFTCLQSSLLAANRYIRAGAAGLNNGSSWTDAWPTLASVTWIRGDTYYLAGGSYRATIITEQSPGALWITIKKANTADNSGDVGWNPVFETDVAVINGVTSLQGNRFEINGVTGNGIAGHGIKFTILPNSTTLAAAFVQPAQDATVTITVGSTADMLPGTTIKIPNGGVFTGGYYSISSILSPTTALVKLLNNSGLLGDTLAPTGATIAAGVNVTGDGTALGSLRLVGSGSGGYKLYHLDIRNMAYNAWQSGNGLHDGSLVKKGVHIAYCWIHQASNNGVTMNNAQGTSFSDYGMLFENNYVTETGGAGDGGHGQGMKFQGSNSYVIIRNNVFRNNAGTGTIVFLDSNSEIHTFFQIYNNVFYKDDPVNFPGTSPAVIYGRDLCTTNDFLIANNTIWGYRDPLNASNSQMILAGNPALGGSAQRNVLINNIFENGYWTSGGNLGFTTVSNNAYFNNTGNSGGASIPVGTPKQVNGVASTFVNAAAGDFRLIPGGYAIGKARNLPSIFTTDIVGLVRGGVWDAGAYQLSTTGNAAPTNAEVRITTTP